MPRPLLVTWVRCVQRMRVSSIKTLQVQVSQVMLLMRSPSWFMETTCAGGPPSPAVMLPPGPVIDEALKKLVSHVIRVHILLLP